MDWDKLKIFHAVAEAGNFTKATYVLNLSQSAISRQIQSLEQELKTQLFERHARGLSLTENGEYLFKNGIFAQPIRYPTVSRNHARIRISITARLTDEQIAKSLCVLENAKSKFHLI